MSAQPVARVPGPDRGRRSSAVTRQLLSERRFVIGSSITIVVLIMAFAGGVLAPHGPDEVVGAPFSPTGPLGTDYLGQDVLSRLLHGGREILIVAFLGTALGMVAGSAVGIIAAYNGGWRDEVVMRLNDVVLAFPQILLALLVLTSVDQPANWIVVLLVGVSHTPRVARVSRGVAFGLVTRDFVLAAEALGESRSRVILAEVVPNMVVPLLAEAGIRLTYSIGIVAALGFLGFSSDPTAANWGQMINENRLGLLTQPWGVIAPVLLIGVFTVGTNLLADGIAQITHGGAEGSR